jgi:hypothetical protein
MIESCKQGSFIRLLSNVYIGNQGLDSFIDTNSQETDTALDLNRIESTDSIQPEYP